MDRLQFIAGREDGGRTVAAVLKERFLFSRSLLRRIKKEGEVLLNGRQALLVERVKEGDKLLVSAGTFRQSDIEPGEIQPDIIYEDESILVANKPAGMLVHPVAGERRGTLANLVMGHWLRSGKQNPVFRPVYRIDRDTTGLVLVSGSHVAHLGLIRQLHEKTMKRKYIAVAEGRFSKPQGIIREPIARKPGSIIEREVSPSGAAAVTHYRVIKHLADINATVLEVGLETGRTHQIRVHLSYLGHPLLGDTLYGGACRHIARQALHSYRLALFHPATGAEMEFECLPPEDMQKLIGGLPCN